MTAKNRTDRNRTRIGIPIERMMMATLCPALNRLA